MNSRTSRPRSPTRQITLTSADVERAIMPSSDDLPTPEPAKMPSRWPRPQGTSASSARTPSDDALVDARARAADRAARPRPGAQRVGRRSGPAVERAAEAVEHAAEQVVADTSTRSGWPVARRRARPGRCPSARRAASAACGRRGSRRPRRAPAARPRPVVDRADLADLGLEAGRLDDQADQVDDAAVAAVQVGVAQSARRARSSALGRSRRASSSRARPATTSRARSSLVSTRASTSPSGVRTTAPPRATRRSAWTSQCSMPPSEAAQLVHRLAHELEVVGVDEHGDALALDDAAQRAADGLDARARARRRARRRRSSRRARGRARRRARSSRSAALGLRGAQRLGAPASSAASAGASAAQRLGAARPRSPRRARPRAAASASAARLARARP